MLEGISMSKRWCKLHSLCASFLRLSECHLSCLQWAECFTLSGIPANLYFFHLVHEIVQSLCDLQCLQHPLPWKSSWNNMKTVCLHFAYAAKCNKDAYRSRKKIHLVKGTADLEVRSLYHDRTFPAFSNSCYRSLLSPLLLSRWGWEIPSASIHLSLAEVMLDESSSIADLQPSREVLTSLSWKKPSLPN